MTKLIKQINDRLNIDKITYVDNFEYKNSRYASMDFPEVGGLDLFNIAPEPPKNSSDITRNELLYLQRITTSRSKSQMELIHTIDDDPMHLFKKVVSKYNLDFPTNFFKAAYYTSVIAIVDHLKFFYNRPRPYQLARHYDIRVNRIITKTHKTPAYPSGHTMYAALISEILSDKYPQHKQEFEKQVSLCGEARELQGVHYPSDNTASIKIMKTIYPQIKKYYIGVGYEL